MHLIGSERGCASLVCAALLRKLDPLRLSLPNERPFSLGGRTDQLPLKRLADDIRCP